MPYISAPYRLSSLLERIRSNILQVPLTDTKGRQIDLAPWPECIDKNGVVHFQDTGRPEAQRMRTVRCKPDIDVDIRRIWKNGDETVAFIGFVRPSFGAIPPLSEFQAQLWALSLLKRLPRTLHHEDSYRLGVSPSKRIQYGVDHESYAYQLALDTGSAPSLWEVIQRGWKITLVWALGANFNTKFRLEGPWKWDGADEVMKRGLWETISRRGGVFGHITLLGILMLVFGTLSALCFIISTIFGLLNYVRVRCRRLLPK
ncbi:hypothetical protein AOQ84DRAFT_398435 [Glonium stellatum]|uniref:Uncharacterized protein n=1 Tax=Glonium stellatum TaxID=574774 RepID=A0A8E2F046_9PEZI|nr:hypothetical protein AOQ84DRAFT_398435 [Glonium stellatum]